MSKRILIWLLPPLLQACAATGVMPAGDHAPPEAPAYDQAVRDLLARASDPAVNRLGQPDGYWGNPRVRIRMPEELARLDKTLRRLGLERQADEFAESLNRAAEEAIPAAKLILAAAVRDLQPADAAAIVRGDDSDATRYFRARTEAALAERFRPVVARAMDQVGVTAAYKRLLRKLAFLDKRADPGRLDLDTYVTGAALDGLFAMLAEEEQRIRRDPRARSTELLKRTFR